MYNETRRPRCCRYCTVELERMATGRPRSVCGQAECQRRADADRKARLRRRKAGLPDDGYGAIRYPVGGRNGLVRRMVLDLATRCFPHVQPTEAEVAALDVVARAGIAWYELLDGLSGKDRFGRSVQMLDPSVRRVLRRLHARDRAGDAHYQAERAYRQQRRDERSHLWEEISGRILNPKAHGNVFGQLLQELPEERRESTYRALARTLHPDVGGDAELMKQLNTAYESVTALQRPKD